MTRVDMDLLEDVLDRGSLPDMLDSLAEICSAKADHVRESYGDNVTARLWDIDATKLLICEYSVRTNAPIPTPKGR